MTESADNAMQAIESAYESLLAVTNPTIEHFKALTQLEASGQGFYDTLAAAAPNDEVRRLLTKNGQEELGHAHRLRRVIGILYGEEFAIPAGEQSALGDDAVPPLTAQNLRELAQAERGGEDFYERWATAVGNADAARLLRLNGKEESGHAERLGQAISLLEAAPHAA